MESFSVKDFFELLTKNFHLSCDLHSAHQRGWLEDEDERHGDRPLDKRTAARISHEFMRLVLGLPNLEDIGPALELKDLFTCRVCANHIAQVYCRGIMDCEEIESPEKPGQIVKIFDSLALLSQAQAGLIVEKLTAVYNQHK